MSCDICVMICVLFCEREKPNRKDIAMKTCLIRLANLEDASLGSIGAGYVLCNKHAWFLYDGNGNLMDEINPLCDAKGDGDYTEVSLVLAALKRYFSSEYISEQFRRLRENWAV